MPFIDKKQAFEILDDMEKGTCIGSCRQVWLRNIGYALKTQTNPLQLTKAEGKRMTMKVARVKDKKKGNLTRKVEKKYTTRKSPPYPANEHCNKRKRGNDGKMYVATPDKNNVCKWKQV